MKRNLSIWGFGFGVLVALLAGPDVSAEGDAFVRNVRQLTFDGRRSGEGYFNADGTAMVFQSERELGNPFYQIYLLDLETGDTQRISPGHGKTTCAWIHPAGDRVLFASTHDDPEAKAKQQRELDDRAAGTQRRYAWDYDDTFELYATKPGSGKYARLTDARGYDAEACYNPEGSKIVFASNRLAYASKLSEEDAKHFAIDPAYMIDLYLMDADGSNVQRLTEAKGYDGGPFFSADGRQICWRRFSADGATAEIYTMDLAARKERKLTSLGAMSWAPYFHPSGEYLIFTTNVHGFANFELYLVAADGRGEPVRVTETEGFDGLPVFSPDGTKLAWTSTRTASKQSQIFIADWDHAAAMAALARSNAGAAAADADEPALEHEVTLGDAAITAEEIRNHVAFLASQRLAGRLTGTEGEQLATRYAAEVFAKLGLEPAGDAGSYYQSFAFTAGVEVGDGSSLGIQGGSPLKLNEQWRPLSYSRTGEVEPTEVVFAGYGIVAPAAEGQEEYDSYVHTDVKGKWVLMYRFMPEGIPAERRQHLSRYASLRYKAMVARDRGAAGVLFVSGPTTGVRQQLVPLSFDASLGGTSIAAVSLSDATGESLLRAGAADKGDLRSLQAKLDTGEMVMGFEIPNVKVGGRIDLRMQKRTGRNVIARLPSGKAGAAAIVIGAHIDHLGAGKHSGSLATEQDAADAIHYGADDNASGVAALLEAAQYLADLKARGKLELQHDLIFACWSGEELGLLGSSHFVQERGDAHGQLSDIAAYLNMDMVGRYRDKLTVQGVGSSSVWAGLVEKANVPVGLAITLSNDSYLPTDSTPFYSAGVPILAAFTGVHSEYHTPRDTADTLNYDGAAKVGRFVALLARQLAIAEARPDYIAQAKPQSGARSGALRAYLGTVPDYAQDESVKGLKLSGVGKGGPAEKAGVQAGDIIVELAGRKIENIYDYTYAIEALKIGQEIRMIVQRGEKRVELQITPTSRD